MKKKDNIIFIILIIIIVFLIGLIIFQKVYENNVVEKEILADETVIMDTGYSFVPDNLKVITYTIYRYNEDNPTVKNINSIKEFNQLLKILKNSSLDQKVDAINGDLALKIELYGDNETILNVYLSKEDKYLNISNDDKMENYKITDEMYNKLLSVYDKDFYLHVGNKDVVAEIPTDEQIISSSDKMFEGLTEIEKAKLKDDIYILHQYISVALDRGHDTLKEPSSIWWETYTTNNSIVDPFSGETINGTNELNNILDRMGNIVGEVKNEYAKGKLQEMYNMLSAGINNHDLDLCYKFHEYVHDYDYWIINNERTKNSKDCVERTVFFGKMI